MSDRPYWWIHESGVYSKNNMPNLLQFEHTCETGPGKTFNFVFLFIHAAITRWQRGLDPFKLSQK